MVPGKERQETLFHLQRSSPKEHVGADMQEFGELVYLIRTEGDSASAFLRDSGP